MSSCEDIILRILPHRLQHLIWIERIAQTVADVVDGDDAEEDHQAREDRQPGIFDEMVLCGGNEIAPGRRRLLDAEAEKAQAGFLNDGITELQCGFDDNDANAVREDMSENDATV